MKRVLLAISVIGFVWSAVIVPPVLAARECDPPPFITSGVPPSILMVMGRDHKLYYEAYNDASDLNGDGSLDISYNHSIEYYGYFDSHKCYEYDGDGDENDTGFLPVATSTSKFCSGTNQWSGNYLNYISMTRMDALRKVLYGGYRPSGGDTASSTVLQGVFVPRDAHSWAKEFTGKLCKSAGNTYTNMCSTDSNCRSGFTCSSLSNNLYLIDQTLVGNTPTSGNRHLFCTTSLEENDDHHVIRIGKNTDKRAWEWASKERPVCDGTVSSTRDLVVKVKVCDDSVGLENNCKQYKDTNNSPIYKPIGILQEFGEGNESGSSICSRSLKPCQNDNDCDKYPGSYHSNGLCINESKLYFGLLTGTYSKPTKGGVLRKNIWTILDEVNEQTGFIQKSENVQGNIIDTIDKMKIVDFAYSNNEYQNCGWITDTPLSQKTDGTCKMWGNPVAEMLYEGMRYLAGESSPSSSFTYSAQNDSGLSLSKPDWGMKKGSDYYHPGDLFPYCSKPSILLLSDVNPTYDADQLPESYFGGGLAEGLDDFTLQQFATLIGQEENFSATGHFIGESSGTMDFSCSAKPVSDMGQIRGLCPEDPTKQGSYYPAAVSYYGRTRFNGNFDNATRAFPDIKTYSVALASPLPELKIKVGTKEVTLVPFAKSVSGSHNVYTNCYKAGTSDTKGCTFSWNYNSGLTLSDCTGNSFCPTNTIVDFYITQLSDTSGNFRINFEDVEQGADHDMDAIILYEYTVIDGNTLEIKVKSENAAGSIDQVLGFIISGTTEDGQYLVVRDKDVSDYQADEDMSTGGICSDPYDSTQCVPHCRRFTTDATCQAQINCHWDTDLNTCYYDNGSDTPRPVGDIPRAWKKRFTISSSPAATLLKNPLWYAAKWGGFDDLDGDDIPDIQNEWDRDGNGVPDTYYLVTNPLELYTKLKQAFLAILGEAGSAGAVATVTQKVLGEDRVIRGAFSCGRNQNESTFWKGHLEMYWPFEGCSDFADNETRCEAVAGCSYSPGPPPECTGMIYSFQKNTSRFCDGDYCWDAAETLNSRIPGTLTGDTGRCIFTWLDGEQTLFGGTSATCPPGMGATSNPSRILSAIANDIDFDHDNNATLSGDGEHLMRWLRGNTFLDRTSAHDRDGWILGDIVYSTPVVVERPSLASVPAGVARQGCSDCSSSATSEDCLKNCFFTYRTFYNRARDKMVYVGANDGMLHAFILAECNATGSWFFERGSSSDSDMDKVADELWSYIPSNLLPELKDIANIQYGTDSCPHRYSVDLSPQAWDVYTTGSDGLRWRTILFGGERSGGDVYFALDVTDPQKAFPLWEFSILKNSSAPDDSNATTLFTRYYDALKTLPLSWSLPYAGKIRTGATTSATVAFIGGGIHEYQPQTIPIDNNSTHNLTSIPPYIYLYYPTFHAVDAETATDWWQSIWKKLLGNGDYKDYFHLATNSTHLVPYAISNVAAFDLYDASGFTIVNGGIQDSYTDVLFGGDLRGTFYTLIMDETNPPDVLSCMTTRKTKTISGATPNPYRTSRQPISVTPVAATDEDGNIRVYFGTGKFQNVTEEVHDDQSDNATMSFYCVIEDLHRPLACGEGRQIVSKANGGLDVYEICDETSTASHHWVKGLQSGSYTADGGTCFPCILDLKTPGERIIDSALVAGGYVFFTTFVPSDDPCKAGGTSYLYALDYMCRPLSTNPFSGVTDRPVEYFDPTTSTWSDTPPDSPALVRVTGPPGITSTPVPDSSGKSILLQSSDGTLLRINADLGGREKAKVKGWSGPNN